MCIRDRYRFYENCIGWNPVLFREKFETEAFGDKAVKTGADEYFQMREKMLEGKSHMSFPKGFIEYVDFLFTLCGGGLFKDGHGICACTVEDGLCCVEEVLSTDPKATAVAAACSLGCGRAEYYLTSDSGEPFIAADKAFPKGTIFNLVCE